MKKTYIILGAIAGVILLMIVWIAGSYNGMLTQEQSVDNAWSNVESQYQRRKDLIPNLERTVKAYTKYEGDTYLAVTKARSAAMTAQEDAAAVTHEGAPTDEQQMQRFMDAQDNARRALDIYVNAVKEAYPDLKSSQNFADFQAQLEGTENRIQIAREEYNAAVKEYNIKVRKFPNVLISGMLGFGKRSMFQAEAGARRAPQVFEE